MSFRSRPALVLALLSAVIAAPCTASAETPNLSANQVQLRAKLQVKQQARRQPQNQNAQYNLDIKPPELKRFALDRSVVRVSEAGAGELMVELVATDGLTGVMSAEVVVRHVETGWGLSGQKYIAVPMGRVNMGVPVSIYGDAPAGEWRVDSVNLRDANGNLKAYDAEALSAMGSTSFQVDNRVRTDGIPPELVGGSVLTPVVSRSKPPKGEYPDQAPRVGLSLSATDTGVSKVSGLSTAYATLCDEYGWDCMYLGGSALKLGAGSGRIVVGATVNSWINPGRYTIYSVEIIDRQGNGRSYSQWDTDFNAMFGGDASITITD